jgi:hypothetical protein
LRCCIGVLRIAGSLYSNFGARASNCSARSHVTVCAEAATSYAVQTEVYSDAIKLLMYESRSNPTEQAERLEKLKPRHEAFKQAALTQEQESSAKPLVRCARRGI